LNNRFRHPRHGFSLLAQEIVFLPEATHIEVNSDHEMIKEGYILRKPKGMHSTTFMRLANKARHLEMKKDISKRQQ